MPYAGFWKSMTAIEAMMDNNRDGAPVTVPLLAGSCKKRRKKNDRTSVSREKIFPTQFLIWGRNPGILIKKAGF